MRKNILNIALAVSFYHAPILILMSIFGLSFGGIQIGFALLLLNALVGSIGTRKRGFKINAMDLSISAWFLALLPSFLVTLANSFDYLQLLSSSGAGLVLPLAYLLFRMAWVSDFKVDVIIILLLKITCTWIVVEFIVVNTFDLNQVIEDFLNPIFNSTRVYDGLLSNYVKAAGPIPGPQNASILAAIACIVFAYAADGDNKRSFHGWVIVSIVALLCSLTLTGLIVLLILATIKYRIRFIVVALVAILGMWVGYVFGILDFILAIKNGNDINSIGQSAEYLNLFGVSEFSKVIDVMLMHPFGLGWACEVDCVSNESGVNQEIYILRLIVLGGWPIALAIIGLLVFNYLAIKSPSLISSDYLMSYRVAGTYICAFLISMIHYASVSVLSIAVIFAAMCAQILFARQNSALNFG